VSRQPRGTLTQTKLREGKTLLMANFEKVKPCQNPEKSCWRDYNKGRVIIPSMSSPIPVSSSGREKKFEPVKEEQLISWAKGEDTRGPREKKSSMGVPMSNEDTAASLGCAASQTHGERERLMKKKKKKKKPLLKTQSTRRRQQDAPKRRRGVKESDRKWKNLFRQHPHL